MIFGAGLVCLSAAYSSGFIPAAGLPEPAVLKIRNACCVLVLMQMERTHSVKVEPTAVLHNSMRMAMHQHGFTDVVAVPGVVLRGASGSVHIVCGPQAVNSEAAVAASKLERISEGRFVLVGRKPSGPKTKFKQVVVNSDGSLGPEPKTILVLHDGKTTAA